SEHGPKRSFEEFARALADEVNRAVEQLSDIDVEALARTASDEAERARQWVDELARSFRPQSEAPHDVPFGPPAAEDPLRNAGPHPLDLPTTEQGTALAALESGRWGIEPGTNALSVHGEGPGPSDALGLVREL